MDLKSKLKSILIFIIRVSWIGSILFLVYLKKPFYLTLLIFAIGIAIEGAFYSLFFGESKDKVKIGASFLSLEVPQFLIGAIIAGLTLGFIHYGNIIKAKDQKDIEFLVRNIIYEEMKDEHRDNDKNKIMTPKELISEANDEYTTDNFEESLKILAAIQTDDETILENKAYLLILSSLKLYNQQMKNFIVVDKNKISELDELFKRYLNEYKDNYKFTIIYYHYGHFNWKILGNELKAVSIFDDMIRNYWYSDWVQGSLYYSSVIHHKSSNPDEIKLSIEQMKILSRQDGMLKIFDTGQTVDASKFALRALESWNVPSEDIKRVPQADLKYISDLQDKLQHLEAITSN